MPTPLPLSVEGINKSYGTQKAVRDLSFEVKAGEVVGIIGPNGAGKTTTVKMILGLLEADKGKIEIFGSDIHDAEVKRRIGYMPETPSFFNHLTGRELIHFVGELFGIDKKTLKTRANELITLVGLEKAADRPLRGYSKGMLQRVCLAQALVNEPDLLFLDEPMDGLDPVGRIRMKEVILRIKERGASIVFNSHILSDVEAISDRIIILDQGTLVKTGTVKQVVPAGKTLEDVFIELVEAKDEE